MKKQENGCYQWRQKDKPIQKGCSLRKASQNIFLESYYCVASNAGKKSVAAYQPSQQDMKSDLSRDPAEAATRTLHRLFVWESRIQSLDLRNRFLSVFKRVLDLQQKLI